LPAYKRLTACKVSGVCVWQGLDMWRIWPCKPESVWIVDGRPLPSGVTITIPPHLSKNSMRSSTLRLYDRLKLYSCLGVEREFPFHFTPIAPGSLTLSTIGICNPCAMQRIQDY